jgi:predicted ATPase
VQIESLKIQNFKALKNVEITNLSALSVFVGANGTGKSTLFDVFGFLSDALQGNVTQALARRGGFKEVISRNATGNIAFEIKFRDSSSISLAGAILSTKAPLVTYQLEVGLDDEGRPVIELELLKYRRGQRGQPWRFLDFKRGEGLAIKNEADYGRSNVKEEREFQQLDSPDILAIKGLGQFQRFKQVSSFRRLIEDWHVSDFHIGEARPSQETGYAEHLSTRGDNAALVAQYMFNTHKPAFATVLKKMKLRVPGVETVDATETTDGRIVLRFQDGAFKDPFIARYVSDGTIKMFVYLLLLHDPKPHPLLCVEEPENQLHPELLLELCEEFREYATRGGQVFISTHSPDFLNGVKLNELFWLVKKDGYTEIKRAADDKQIRALLQAGDKLGELWKQGLFAGESPLRRQGKR